MSRSNPPRAARPRGSLEEAAASESDPSEILSSSSSSFFVPVENNRVCPCCRTKPTAFLRIFPDLMRCPICMSGDIVNAIAFIPCGHCFCCSCFTSWVPNIPIPNSSFPPVANLFANLQIDQDQELSEDDEAGAPIERRGRPLLHPSQRNKSTTVARKNLLLQMIGEGKINEGAVNDVVFYCDIQESFTSPDAEHRSDFRKRIVNAVNRTGDFSYESWVLALCRLNVSKSSYFYRI